MTEDSTETGPPTTMTREVVLTVRLPRTRSVGKVEVRRITMPPGLPAGPHIHNGPVFGVIERGSVILQIDGAAEQTLTDGDVFYEPEGERIARFDAQGDGVAFLGYFPVDADEKPEITMLED